MPENMKRNSTCLCLALVAMLCMPAAAESSELDCLIEPHMVVDIGSPEQGIIERIDVERSDLVAADDVLASLESGEQRATVRKARASAAMQSEVQAREAALALALRKQKRIAELFSSQAISKHQRDEVDTEVTVARMHLRQAKENRRLAQIELERATHDLERRTIRSPIAGVVIERFVAPGEYVHEKPLLRVAQMHPLRIEAIAPAAMFGSVAPGMRAEVITENDSGEVYAAEVKIVDRLIDPASGTFGIRLELPNPDYRIPSGLNCQVRLLPQAPGARSVSNTKRAEPVRAAARSASSGAGKTAPNVCRTFGPFESAAERDTFAASLGQGSRALAERDEAREDVTKGYFVLTEAAGSINAARARAGELRELGVADLAVLTREPNRGRISLGLFTKRASALLSQQSYAERGIETEVLPRLVSASQFWLDAEIAPTAAADSLPAGKPCSQDYVLSADAMAAGTPE